MLYINPNWKKGGEAMVHLASSSPHETKMEVVLPLLVPGTLVAYVGRTSTRDYQGHTFGVGSSYGPSYWGPPDLCLGHLWHPEIRETFDGRMLKNTDPSLLWEITFQSDSFVPFNAMRHRGRNSLAFPCPVFKLTDLDVSDEYTPYGKYSSVGVIAIGEESIVRSWKDLVPFVQRDYGPIPDFSDRTTLAALAGQCDAFVVPLVQEGDPRRKAGRDAHIAQMKRNPLLMGYEDHDLDFFGRTTISSPS